MRPDRTDRPFDGYRNRAGGDSIPPMSPLLLTLILALGAALSFWLLDRYVIGCAKL
jgi:hypothetical protein